MAENSGIEWTRHTWSPWRGCTKVSDGCKHCYADSTAKRNPGVLGIWGPNGSRVVNADWDAPLRWNRQAEKAGERWRIFPSMCDPFEDWDGLMADPQGRTLYAIVDQWVPNPELKIGRDRRPLTMADVRRRLFTLIDATPNLDWLVLTKRPENIARMMPPWEWNACETGDCPHDNIRDCDSPAQRAYRPNVWLGTSVENQDAADERIPHLRRVPAAVRFLSCEPLLSDINLRRHFAHSIRCRECHPGGGPCQCPRIDWIIVGGESGPKARPMHPEWALSIRDQCQAAGVAFFFKQWGEWQPSDCGPIRSVEARRINDAGQDVTSIPELWCGDENMTDAYLYRVGKKAAGRRLDGREWSEFPQPVTV